MKKLFIFLLLLNLACQPQESNQENTENDLLRETEQTIYTEKHRSQLHFSPPTHWMNDPNGMVYFDGEYHLFYQHYPDSTVWGPMHWGHAVSKDLIHWEHLPIALYPDSLGYIFSGSAVVDWYNTSGFGTEDNPPLVAIYTYHDPKGEKAKTIDFQSQAIAYSLDKGRTWKKYQNNPVIPNPGIRDFRDPKVIWHQESENWIMVFAAQELVKIYSSPDLKSWTLESEFGRGKGSHGGVWECPDLFPLQVDGSEKEKWVMLVSIGSGGPNGGSATQYFVGDFDGKTFTADEPFNQKDKAHWLDHGTDNYAGVTWSDTPEEDGRRIFIGWMSNWQYAQVVPTQIWRSAMTLPRVLKLKETEKGLLITSHVVKEINNIKENAINIQPQTFIGELKLDELIADTKGLFEIELVLEGDASKEQELGIRLSNTQGESLVIGLNILSQQLFYVDRSQAGEAGFSDAFGSKHTSPRVSRDQEVHFQVIVDVASVELFADGGEVVMSEIFFPNEVYSQLSLFSNQESKIKRGKITPLQSIWKN